MPKPLFQKGNPGGPGRARGQLSAPKALLRDAFVIAANEAGGGGKDGVVNYLKRIAITHPAVFVPALTRIIPLEITARSDHRITVEVVQSPVSDARTIDAAPVNGQVSLCKPNGHETA